VIFPEILLDNIGARFRIIVDEGAGFISVRIKVPLKDNIAKWNGFIRIKERKDIMTAG
jgi:hypothetical protein